LTISRKAAVTRLTQTEGHPDDPHDQYSSAGTDQLKTLLANYRRLNAMHRPEYAEAAAGQP
jgi:hypothetical protein